MKPELVISIQNIDFFNAALEGGADGFALGLSQYNLDPTNSDFSMDELLHISSICKKEDKKIYFYCNKPILNEDLFDVIEFLSIISQEVISGIIIQDWGLFYILKKHFPNLPVIADTIMNFNSSIGINMAEELKFDRVVLSRELFLNEITEIKKKTTLPIELQYYQTQNFYRLPFKTMPFVNDITQKAMAEICTKSFISNFDVISRKKFLFSLKDHLLIDYVPKFKDLGVKTLQFDGRLHSTEYTYLLTKAYRAILDGMNIEKAKSIINIEATKKLSVTTNKRNLSDSLQMELNNGILLGSVKRIDDGEFSFSSSTPIKAGHNLSIYSEEGKLKHEMILQDFDINKRNFVKIYTEFDDIERGDFIFLTQMEEEKYKSDVKTAEITPPTSNIDVQKVLNSIQPKKTNEEEEKTVSKQIFVRIDSLSWIRKIYLSSIDKLILKLPKRQWSVLKIGNPFIIKNKAKFILQLPDIIIEKDLAFYENLCNKFFNEGFTQFMVSHLSHRTLIPKGAKIYLSEQTPAFNDAAISFFEENNIENWILPFNYNVDNLVNSNSRKGIVPMHYHLPLIHSRVPINFPKKTDEIFEYDEEHVFHRDKRDDITSIYRDKAYTHFNHIPLLLKKGYENFLVDLSFVNPSQNTFNTLLNPLRIEESTEPKKDRKPQRKEFRKDRKNFPSKFRDSKRTFKKKFKKD